MVTGPGGVRSAVSRGPVEVAAAGLAVDQGALLAQLLEPLGGDGDAAAPAEVRLDHLGDGGATMAEDLVVVGEHGDGQPGGELGALALDDGDVGLHAAELLAEHSLLALAL